MAKKQGPPFSSYESTVEHARRNLPSAAELARGTVEEPIVFAPAGLVGWLAGWFVGHFLLVGRWLVTWLLGSVVWLAGCF